MIIFGAAIVGEATLYACRAKGIAVECFVDHRIRGSVGGVEVLTLEAARKKYGPSCYYLTSPNIADMIGPLNQDEDWHTCGQVLEGFDISGIVFESINGSNETSRYSTEHVQYLIRTCLHHHENYLHPEVLTVPSVDLMITEKCSMKCRDCSNLMQYYEHPENGDLKVMYAMIDGLCAMMDELYEFRVIGGEPFMHKELDLVVEHACAIEKVQKVSIFTNATILPREHQWEALRHPKVRLFITDYDELSRNRQRLIAELERLRIAYVCERANGWTDCASLEKHNRTVEENKAIWNACCAKNLATLADGRLYRCPFAANAHKLKAVPDYKEDYLVVQETSKEEVRSFLRDKTMIETCDHCNGRSYDAPVIKAGIQVKKPLTYVKYERATVGS